MTNKEKFIETFKQTPDDSICPVYCSDAADGSKCPYLKSSWCDWWDMEYKVEQESALDKIRSEILNETHHILDGKPIIEIEEVLQIIDKHKVEGEDKE